MNSLFSKLVKKKKWFFVKPQQDMDWCNICDKSRTMYILCRGVPNEGLSPWTVDRPSTLIRNMLPLRPICEDCFDKPKRSLPAARCHEVTASKTEVLPVESETKKEPWLPPLSEKEMVRMRHKKKHLDTRLIDLSGFMFVIRWYQAERSSPSSNFKYKTIEVKSIELV